MSREASCSLCPQQATENPFTDLEGLHHCRPGAFSGWVRVSPRSQMLFRPAAVDARSERVAGVASVVTAPPVPDHDAVALRPYPPGRGCALHGSPAGMAARRD